MNDHVFRVAAKVGVALFPNDGADADTLLNHAKAALTEAKAHGDRVLLYGRKMSDTSVVRLVSGRLTGAEALLRSHDPRSGLLPPERFIPLLEETGLIREVGRWVLHQAIQDYLGWCAAGLAAVRIAVNVSPRQLGNKAFVHEVRQVIAGMRRPDWSWRSPKASSCRTSSTALRAITQANGQVLISAIINLALSLKLTVVAEAVETEEPLRLLRELNCDEMQGYVFGGPGPGPASLLARCLGQFGLSTVRGTVARGPFDGWIQNSCGAGARVSRQPVDARAVGATHGNPVRRWPLGAAIAAGRHIVQRGLHANCQRQPDYIYKLAGDLPLARTLTYLPADDGKGVVDGGVWQSDGHGRLRVCRIHRAGSG